MYKFKLLLIILLVIFSGCARWAVAPQYETAGYHKGVNTKKVFVSKIESVDLLPESDVSILGFVIEPDEFLKRDIGEYLRHAIIKEGVESNIFTEVKSLSDADYEISGEVKEFYYKMNVEEIPMKAEGYAYYYNVDFSILLHAVVKQKGITILDENYKSRKRHATVYHTLTSWEKPFIEDMNVVMFDVVEDLFIDMGRRM